jgi:hypothetical protein
MTLTDQNYIHKGIESKVNEGNGCDRLVQIHLPAIYVKIRGVRVWFEGEYVELRRWRKRK